MEAKPGNRAGESGWEILQTRQGLALRVRPEQPDDAPHLVDLFQHLGPMSRYLRFNKALVAPDPERIHQEAERLARLGPPQELAWLAFADLPEQPDAPVAGARCALLGPERAELALSVRDDMQRQGIGSAMLKYVLEQARARGIREMVAIFRADNRGVWELLKHSPYPVSRELRGIETEAVIHLDDEPAA